MSWVIYSEGIMVFNDIEIMMNHVVFLEIQGFNVSIVECAGDLLPEYDPGVEDYYIKSSEEDAKALDLFA